MSSKKRVDNEMLLLLRAELEKSINELSIFFDELSAENPVGGIEIDISLMKHKANNVKHSADNLANIRTIN